MWNEFEEEVANLKAIRDEELDKQVSLRTREPNLGPNGKFVKDIDTGEIYFVVEEPEWD